MILLLLISFPSGGICWRCFALWWVCDRAQGWRCKPEGDVSKHFTYSLRFKPLFSFCFSFEQLFRVVVLGLSKWLLRVLWLRNITRSASIFIHSFTCCRPTGKLWVSHTDGGSSGAGDWISTTLIGKWEGKYSCRCSLSWDCKTKPVSHPPRACPLDFPIRGMKL